MATSKEKILLVESNPTPALRLRLILEKAGYQCVVVENGERALEYLKLNKTFLVISDVILPGIDGFELCSAIKNAPEFIETSVFLLICASESHQIIEVLNAHADYYFTKPYDTERLLKQIKKIDTESRCQDEPCGTKISLDNKIYTIKAAPEEILNLLVATYDDAMSQNSQLAIAEQQLNKITSHLEEKCHELKASEDRFRALVETIPDIVYRIDEQGFFVFVNPAVKSLGYDTEELIGKHFCEIIHHLDREKVSRVKVTETLSGINRIDEIPLKFFDERRRGERMTSGLEVRLVRKDGAGKTAGFLEPYSNIIALVEVDSSGLYKKAHADNESTNNESFFIGTVGVIRDISERKRTDMELLESKEQFQRAVIEAPYPVMIHLESGEIIQLNKAWHELSGYGSDEFNHIEEWITKVSTAENRVDISNYFTALVNLNSSCESNEYNLIKKDGERCFWQFKSAALGRNQNGHRIVITMAADVTERCLAEQSIIESLDATEASSRAKSEFLASMSHELRTPLNAVIGFSEILQEELFGELNAKQMEYVTDILQSGYHLLDLINDILDIAKVESGKMTLCLSELMMGDVLRNSFTIIKEKCHRIGIQLRLYISDELKNRTIHADHRKLKQVMYNLLSNAAKFTQKNGSIEIIADFCDNSDCHLPTQERCVQVSVKDNGIGIKAENLEKIFDEFYQVGSQLNNKTAGTGLGLTISRSLIEMHHGKLWAESNGEGKGTVFKFTLPTHKFD